MSSQEDRDRLNLGRIRAGGLAAVAALLAVAAGAADAQEIVQAFAFGSRNLLCTTQNEPTFEYTMVYHISGDPNAIAYNAAKGFGYVITNPGDTSRSGFGIFGPFDESPNNRNKFADSCPEQIYDSFIGAKSFATGCSTGPCLPYEGVVFRIDIPNGTYRFVGAFGEADNMHTHTIIVEDGGEGVAGDFSLEGAGGHVVIVQDFNQAAYDIGQADATNKGEGVFARVGFEGLIPPEGDGVAPDPQFVDMDEDGLPTDPGEANSPTLTVTEGYIRLHQLQGASFNGAGGTGDPNGGDAVIFEIWSVTTTGCTPPKNLACSPDPAAKLVRLSWTAPSPAPASYKIERDGAVIEAALAGSATRYEDKTVDIGKHEYKVTPAGCDKASTCNVDLCPSGLACSVKDGEALLSWTSKFPAQSYRILRDGVEIGTAPGDATSFADAGVTTGRYTYEVAPLPAGCDTLSCRMAIILPPDACYAAPEDDGWDYSYDPKPGDKREEMVQYEPLDQTPGCLDSEWQRSNGSDRWDGSAPGEVDENDPNGPSPGGIGLSELDGQGYAGERIGVLTIEDAGDPSAAAFRWKGAAKSWTDAVNAAVDGTGSNRKIFLGANLDRILDLDPGLNLMAEGATLSVRFRLMPLADAQDIRAERIGLNAPQGSTIDGSGKGFINLYTEVGGTKKISFSIDGTPQAGYQLFVAGVADARFVIGDPTRWITLYATIQDPEADGTYDLKLYANGATEPFYQREDYAPVTGGSELTNSQNYLMLGSNQTGEVCAYEVDFISVKAGVHEPKVCEPLAGFLRGDTDGNGAYTIGDGIQILDRLFAGRDAYDSNCEDTGDLDDNDLLTIGDAIYVFNYLFAGGDEPAPPFPDCGPDPDPAASLGCEGYPAENCPK